MEKIINLKHKGYSRLQDIDKVEIFTSDKENAKLNEFLLKLMPLLLKLFDFGTHHNSSNIDISYYLEGLIKVFNNTKIYVEIWNSIISKEQFEQIIIANNNTKYIRFFN